MSISFDDFNRDPYRAAAAMISGKAYGEVTTDERERAKEAMYRSLMGRFQIAAKNGDARDERLLLDQLAAVLRPAPGTTADVLEVIVRGRADRGKTTTAGLIKLALQEADYTDVKIADDTPPATDKDRWWNRFQKTRARAVRIKVETVK